MFQSDCVILKPAKFPIAIMSKGGKVGGGGGGRDFLPNLALIAGRRGAG